jgi:hypothetical protein
MNPRKGARCRSDPLMSASFMTVKGQPVPLGEVLGNPSVRRQAVDEGLAAAAQWEQKYGILPELADVTKAVRHGQAGSREGKLTLWPSGSLMVDGTPYLVSADNGSRVIEALPSGSPNAQGARVSWSHLRRRLFPQLANETRTAVRRTPRGGRVGSL